ncbi:hypothetical protein B0H19DRAFT_595013 [Mycena capillaripes]|nr:hypothetical protein B0H19DRAFT_595013 [Mycena capillaripes]
MTQTYLRSLSLRLAMVDTRDSVYHLSSLASLLQSQEETINYGCKTDIQPRLTSLGRSLNHLSTLLSRGATANEEDRVVVLVADRFDARGLHICVYSRYGSEPPSCTLCVFSLFKKNCSPSSSPITSPAGPSESPSDVAADSTKFGAGKKVTKKGAKRGTIFQKTLTPPDPAAALPTLDGLVQKTTFDLDPLPFPEFVAESINILRTAAVRVHTGSPNTSKTIMAVRLFFVVSCMKKIASRRNLFLETYGSFEELETWAGPTEAEDVPSCEVSFKGHYFAMLLEIIGLPASSSSEIFPFNKATAILWWKALVRLIKYLSSSLDEEHAGKVVLGSETVHDSIHQIPSAMWELPSLAAHLRLYCVPSEKESGTVGRPPIQFSGKRRRRSRRQ